MATPSFQLWSPMSRVLPMSGSEHMLYCSGTSLSNRLRMSMSKEVQTTAILEGERLCYQGDGQDYQVQVGTPAWYAWLQTAMRFRVRSPFGTFSVHREQAGNQRGHWYWRAYRKRDGQLQRVYVGKAEEVTPQRLHAVARQLFGQGEQHGDVQAVGTPGSAPLPTRET